MCLCVTAWEEGWMQGPSCLPPPAFCLYMQLLQHPALHAVITMSHVYNAQGALIVKLPRSCPSFSCEVRGNLLGPCTLPKKLLGQCKA